MSNKLEENLERLHIYPLSRLVGAPAPKWERILRELEADEKRVYRYYQPVREAIVALTNNGSLRRDAIVKEMLEACDTVPHGPSQDVIGDNMRAFLVFETHFLKRISTFKHSLLRLPQGSGVQFEGLGLLGTPHMTVTDKSGSSRYVYLYPSRWKDDHVRAYLELLTIILEDRFDATAKDLWCMNLRTGKDVPWKKSLVSVRKDCRDCITHYLRVTRKQPITVPSGKRKAYA